MKAVIRGNTTAVTLDGWLREMPIPTGKEARLTVPTFSVKLCPTDVGLLVTVMLKQRASLAAIVAHALSSDETLCDMSNSDTPIDGVEGTANPCAECRDVQRGEIDYLETFNAVMDEVHCIACDRRI